ncbi:MAG: pantoate kinase [Candidatus Thorarchaeota archaeon]
MYKEYLLLNLVKADVADTLKGQQNEEETAKAFVPGHITGIFRIFDNYDNPLRCGSMGAGFSVAIGTVTSVSVVDNPMLEITTDYNKQRIDAQVTKTVVQRMTEEYERTLRVHVDHNSSLAIGAGFGASGAGALGTALALGHMLDPEIEYEKAAGFAHIAEITNHTGLGDVLAQTVGGLEVRVQAGGPGVGKIQSIDYQDTLLVALAGSPGLETAKVLTNPSSRQRINTIGEELVTKLIDNPTVEMFIECSREFSEKIGLQSTRVKQALNILDREGLTESSMVMLGDSVFCFCNEENSSVAQGILLDYWDASEVFMTSISVQGGKLIK